MRKFSRVTAFDPLYKSFRLFIRSYYGFSKLFNKKDRETLDQTLKLYKNNQSAILEQVNINKRQDARKINGDYGRIGKDLYKSLNDYERQKGYTITKP